MPDLRPVFWVVGVLLTTLGGMMLLPALVDASSGHEEWRVFCVTSLVTLFAGMALTLGNRGRIWELSVQQAFLLTVLSWLMLAVFAALPLAWSELRLSYTDAFFEAMSGLTTTGATVIRGLDEAPPGVLLWRALLQWMGGIGIIVTAVAVLPMLRIGGMQLFRLESTDNSEKILPRAAQLAGSITGLYVTFSLLCGVSYWLAGMTPFDSAAHAMTTIATGGFSTSDHSIGAWDSAAIDSVAVVFMVAGSVPFVLYLQFLRGQSGGRRGALWRDTQVKWFAGLLATFIAIIWLHRFMAGVGADTALRQAAFNVTSIMTGTGYATADYSAWSGFAAVFFFIIMFIGGCAGSTSCGLKVFRVAVMVSAVRLQVRRLMRPHEVVVSRYNGRPIPPNVSAAVMSFFFFYIASFTLTAATLAILGVDYLTALSASASAISNVGPGLGPVVGPSGDFSVLPETAKWLLAAVMLIGRLEVFTVLVLFLPSFWRG